MQALRFYPVKRQWPDKKNNAKLQDNVSTSCLTKGSAHKSTKLQQESTQRGCPADRTLPYHPHNIPHPQIRLKHFCFPFLVALCC